MDYELQKASLWKRIAAWLFDLILAGILAVGIAALLSAAVGYDKHSDAVSEAYTRYEAEYGITFEVSGEEYQSWPEEKKQAYDEAYKALTADEQAMYSYNMVVNLTMLVASLSILAAVVALELVVPLLLKNGQTLGKKIFSLCVVRQDCVRVNGLQMVARTILGKFAVETMVPVYILLMLFWGITGLPGTVILLALLLAQIIILLVTRRNAAIHDLLAGTAVADYSGQRIFGSEAELTEYVKRIHAERAARQEY